MNLEFTDTLTHLVRVWAREEYKQDMSHIGTHTIGHKAIEKFLNVVRDWSYFQFCTEDRMAMEEREDVIKEWKQIVRDKLRRTKDGKVVFLNQLEKEEEDG
jgi:hypothetical protein